MGKTKALREAKNRRALLLSLAGAHWRMDPSHAPYVLFVLPWSGGSKQEGHSPDKGPRPFLIHRIADRDCLKTLDKSKPKG